MSLRQHARRTKRTVANAFIASYGRCMQYSRIIDKINRRPLLHSFTRKNSNVPSFPTREAMWSFIASRAPAAIDYLEFGVHEGHSILHFAEQNSSINSRFFGFDCFTGLPEDWNGNYKQGHFDTGGRIPTTVDSRVEFVVGMFQETLPKFILNFKTNNKIVVHLDCDLYSSALYCLTKLDAVLPTGTVLIFDEFGDVLHEFRALNDYISSYRREVNVICSHDDFFTIAVELL
jgi:O-methyltransferase